jgi:hypothetical protein
VKRAAVLIGVDRTGGLQPLQAAAAGARGMEQWARGQHMDPIEVLTDEGGTKVAIRDIKDAVKRIIDAGTTEQLVVYFAGHGVNRNYGEYWLLSDAPDDTNAAVNVASSALLARYCGIPHIVIISDACRTAPQTLQAQLVNGSEIFPNLGLGGRGQPVDQFWACLLGKPAVEYELNARKAAKEYTALFTSALLDALEGRQADLLEAAADGRYLRPKPLRDYLYAELAKRIEKLNLVSKVIQEPEAQIVSEDTAWVARLALRKPRKPPAKVKAKPKAKAKAAPRPPQLERAPAPPAARSVPATASALVQELLDPVLLGDRDRLRTVVDRADAAGVLGAADAARALAVTAVPFGPAHHETQCGFKIRGSRFTGVTSPHARPEQLDDGHVVRMWNVRRPGVPVLLRLVGGLGVVLPAIPDFLASITIDDDELVDVAYEPSDNSPRWDEFEHRADELRGLRAVASSSTRNGVFRLDGDRALEFARAMQQGKGIDPTLAVYAAYAYHDLARRDLIEHMARYMRRDIGAVLYDVAMLAGLLRRRTLGFVPLLSQGWPLRGALGATLPPSLDGLEAHLMPSTWTLFDANGVRRIRDAMNDGEL